MNGKEGGKKAITATNKERDNLTGTHHETRDLDGY